MIGVAVDYYERRDDAPAAARAHYLAGIVDSKAQRNTDAAVHMLMAEKFALQDSTDHFLAGLVYRGLANCYEEFYELETAREYLIKAYGEFLKTDSLLHAGYVAVQASRRSLDLLEYDEITRYAKSATDIARKIGNDNLLTAAKITEARAYVRQRKYGDAIELYEELLTYESNEFIEEDYMNLGLAYLMTGENELADQCNANVSSYEYDLHPQAFMGRCHTCEGDKPGGQRGIHRSDLHSGLYHRPGGVEKTSGTTQHCRHRNCGRRRPAYRA